MTTTDRLRRTLSTTAYLPQRRELARLLHLLAAGCRSQLELWGFEHVFTGSGFEVLRWGVPVRIGGRTIWLDAYDESSRTNLELDGAKYHGSPRDRGRDVRRDALLATIDIHAIRFTHDRLTTEAAQARQEALTIMAVRRRIRSGDALAA